MEMSGQLHTLAALSPGKALFTHFVGGWRWFGRGYARKQTPVLQTLSTNFTENLTLIALMMAVASTSETSVNVYQTTWCNNPEDSHLHTRHRENLKSHPVDLYGEVTPS
jgi:hypothetical protein